ncbi:hypothetical protein [Pusillimonas sp.]|uniref:hypothetical protein n=1 Tax=Pusillimonas sp. TaxID=3040095 RepID=UPI0037CC5C12
MDQRIQELADRIEEGNRRGKRVPMTDDDWVTLSVRTSHELAEQHGIPYAYMTEEEKVACDFVAAQRTREPRDKYNRAGWLGVVSWAVIGLTAVVVAVVILR